MTDPEYPNAYRYRRIVRAKRYIDEHFDEPIDLEAISDEACFSKYHFLRLFKNAYGKTPGAYLAELRLRRAAALFAEGRHSVTEVCHELGFESLGSFSALFKKTYGLSPTAYRERERREREAAVKEPLRRVPHCFASHNGWT